VDGADLDRYAGLAMNPEKTDAEQVETMVRVLRCDTGASALLRAGLSPDHAYDQVERAAIQAEPPRTRT